MMLCVCVCVEILGIGCTSNGNANMDGRLSVDQTTSEMIFLFQRYPQRNDMYGKNDGAGKANDVVSHEFPCFFTHCLLFSSFLYFF
ncbi:hypothetical protein J3E72DRAFT_314661 [Bipolaris maydis]|uniref:uncharacterized protein n=1 Tax=Cochliobolus heterostrophus TaxID=5016 RepID=UPI0024DB0F5D|nr:hypothetical protein J3E73DRAFT_344247 [Bipolaris maydis]KAJ6197878.1 hypothetical protein J3E72DRAFT_314661 [Bipolaris maydis]KAJ6210004.1 hypothetical protein PSV09DRAFT_2300120 [Bipolaris maydis]KAJ6272444.1 hypothetical protein PSV08DRAFT_290683 [Bipolaris maydis]KAJ6281466.1 hypothetical protein J3E71DRAFT_289961 [Bipolaris maydis]